MSRLKDSLEPTDPKYWLLMISFSDPYSRTSGGSPDSYLVGTLVSEFEMQ
jgi:hypothetical protein